jgi:WD repeat-containing protein 61
MQRTLFIRPHYLCPMKVSAKRVIALTGHQGAVYTVTQGTAVGSIISAGSDRQIAEWQINGINEAKLIARSAGVVYSLLILPNEPLLLIGNDQGGIHVVDLQQKAEVKYLLAHTKGVFHLNFDAKRNQVIAAGADGNLTVWQSSVFQCSRELWLCNAKIRRTAFNHDYSILAVACGDGQIKILNAETLELIHSYQAHTQSVNTVSFSPDGRFLLSGSKDAHLSVWDVGSWTLIKTIPAHNYAIYEIVWHSSGQWFATGSRDKTIKIWGTDQFEILLRIDKDKHQGHVNSVNSLHWIPNTNLIASASDDRAVMLWEIEFSV